MKNTSLIVVRDRELHSDKQVLEPTDIVAGMTLIVCSSGGFRRKIRVLTTPSMSDDEPAFWGEGLLGSKQEYLLSELNLIPAAILDDGTERWCSSWWLEFE